MLQIRAERRAVFDDAIEDALAGRPRVVCIDGSAGMGKTTHLRSLIADARGFRVLEGVGEPGPYRPRFNVLHQLGVVRTVSDDGVPHSPAVAAQSLRRLIDDAGRDAPVLIALDDVQWSDAETLDALRLVIERVSGDRLLMAVAGRPLSAAEHPRWRRFRDTPHAVTTVTLDGIGLEEARTLITETAGREPDEPLTRRLWEHTGRNPLYLRSLRSEYPLEELEEAAELPAPVEVALDLNARLATLDEGAATLLRAVAVVGSSWVDRLDAAAIAGIDDATSALDLLLGSELLIARGGRSLADVRLVHALVRAAIYQSIPDAERRALHLRAAEVLASPMQRLEHEVAAATRRDEALASRLEAAANAAHDAADHRREAQLRQWSSQLSESVPERERRWLESQLASVLAHDIAVVRSRLSEIGWAADVPRRTLVTAWLLIVENRIADARRLLTGPSAETLAAADLATRQRLLVLKAWTMLVSGFATAEVKAVIDAVPSPGELDPAARPFYVRTAGQVAGRELDFDHLEGDFSAVPLAARETPMEDTDRLGWRGAIYSMCGFTADARRDLSEVVSRIRSGRVDAGNGVDHGLYAFALWQDGELERASTELEAATELALDRVHPLVQAMQPLVPIVRGDLARADVLLAESEAVLRDLPWREAISVLMQGQVARLHVGDDDRARAGYLAHIRSVFGPASTSSQMADGAIWQLHVALARVWAGELDEVEGHLVAIETDLIVPDWASWARPWITGLAAEAGGDLGRSEQLLAEAAAASDDELPLYRAHVHADLARVAAATGRAAVAAEGLERARALYARLGATPYLARLDSARGSRPHAEEEVLALLSDREREVANLVLAGYSYTQIAEELYVTRSTVAFHLGKVYAKTGVASRHEFTQLVHGAHR